MPELEMFVNSSRQMLESGASIEQLLVQLRRDGLGVLDSIKVLTRLTGMDLAAAKRTVHFSEAWRDRLGAHEAFHDRVEEAARGEAFGEDADDPPT